VEARGLTNTEILGKSCPYVSVAMVRGKGFRPQGVNSPLARDDPSFETRFVRNELNPFYGEQFSFPVEDIAGLQVEIRVLHWSRYFQHTPLGSKSINISGLVSSRFEDLWIDLDAPLSSPSHSAQLIAYLPTDITQVRHLLPAPVPADSTAGQIHIQLFLANHGPGHEEV
jgi:Ca2+-dependent lipid-binding protein